MRNLYKAYKLAKAKKLDIVQKDVNQKGSDMKKEHKSKEELEKEMTPQ